VTDYLSLVSDQIARFVPTPFVSLGTDGYGLSDTRAALRRHFEVDAGHIVVTVLAQLAHTGEIDARVVGDAIRDLEVDPEAAPPRTR
jgi:pyruvate dehydrogenase E1 component